MSPSLIDHTLLGLLTPASSTGIETSSTPAPHMLPISTSIDAAASLAAAPMAPMENSGFPVWTDWQGVAMDSRMPTNPDMGDMPHFDPELASSARMLGCVTITNLVLDDLNQLYFDRVHDFLPMVHRGRYFSWANQENPSHARVCLRSAMHTVAAAMSAQYLGLSDALFRETYRLLELQQTQTEIRSSSRTEMMWMASLQTYPKSPASDKGDSSDKSDKIPLELVQAWLLLAHYEFLRVNEHQAMLTAGRAFRLVQLAHLYSVDEKVPEMERDDGRMFADDAFIVAEEKRRTFWLAFSYDRFLCSRNGWPLTLEESIHTRLPAPEASFQSGQPVRMGFLSDVLPVTMTPGTPCEAFAMISLPPFTEYVVLSAIHGRCMMNRHVAFLATELSGKQDSFAWYNMLASAVERRIQMFPQSQLSKTFIGGPLALFTHMLARTLLIYLNNTLELMYWQQPQQPKQREAGEDPQATYYLRARRAAREIVCLAASARSQSCFGIHPFIAKPLACTADFFIHYSHIRNARSPENGGVNEEDVEILLNVLRNMSAVNILARDYLRTLETLYNAHSCQRWLER